MARRGLDWDEILFPMAMMVICTVGAVLILLDDYPDVISSLKDGLLVCGLGMWCFLGGFAAFALAARLWQEHVTYRVDESKDRRSAPRDDKEGE